MKRLLALFCASLLLTATGAAADPDDSTAEKAREYFSDVILINQDGQALRFYSDLLKGKVVIINSFFTSCQGICPVMTRQLLKLQEALGDRLGKEVSILSLTVDSEYDTPARLKEYARQNGTRPGWQFLTGKKENVDWALYRLGQYVEAREDHSSVFIIGNESRQTWTKILAMADTAAVLKTVEDVMNAE
jgi:protein SCO1